MLYDHYNNQTVIYCTINWNGYEMGIIIMILLHKNLQNIRYTYGKYKTVVVNICIEK